MGLEIHLFVVKCHLFQYEICRVMKSFLMRVHVSFPSVAATDDAVTSFVTRVFLRDTVGIAALFIIHGES